MAPRWGDREGERDSIINTVESGEWPNQHTLSWRRTETLICIFSSIIFKVHIPILLKFLKNSMWQVVLCTARSVGAECGKENFKAAIFHTCPIQNCIQIKTFASECVKVWLQQQPPGRVDICILHAGPWTMYSTYPTHLSSCYFAVRYILHIEPREAEDLCLVSVS